MVRINKLTNSRLYTIKCDLGRMLIVDEYELKAIRNQINIILKDN